MLFLISMTEEERLKRNAYMREWSRKNYPRLREKKLEYSRSHSKEAVERVRKWRKENPGKPNEYSRKSYRKNKRKKLDYGNAYNRKRRASDPNWRLRKNLSVGIANALKGRWKSKATMQLLGCSLEDFWIHLESKFEPGMTRENYGKVWHVDHIMPSSIFDLTKSEHQKRCFHFSNLQPLFGAENVSKKDKILTNQFQLL